MNKEFHDLQNKRSSKCTYINVALQATSVRINTDYKWLKCSVKVLNCTVTYGGQVKGSKPGAHNAGTSYKLSYLQVE